MTTKSKDQRIGERNKGQLVEIEYLFPIRNIIFKGSEFKIGDVIIKKINPDKDNGILIKRSIVEEQFDPYFNNLGDTIALVEESGTDLESMEEKAARRVDIALNILRTSLSLGMFFCDESALFSRTELVLFRKKGDKAYVFSWHRERKPHLIEFDPNELKECDLCLKKLSNNLFSMPEGFLGQLRKATFWIARSITEDNLDLKIVCVHIALESMLTSIDCGKKGEDLAYRMLLLNLWADEPSQWPEDVLNMYDIRSKIVHQGKMGISTRDDYRTWRRISIYILIRSLSFIESNGIKSHREFIVKLESEERMKEVISWLEFYKDYDDKAIRILAWINEKQKKSSAGLDRAKCCQVKDME